MYPVLAAGDFVISQRLYRHLTIGDTVVVNHPHYGRLIKRVKDIDPLANVWLEGENKESLSSEKMGWITPSMLQGKVIFISKK